MKPVDQWRPTVVQIGNRSYHMSILWILHLPEAAAKVMTLVETEWLIRVNLGNICSSLQPANSLQLTESQGAATLKPAALSRPMSSASMPAVTYNSKSLSPSHQNSVLLTIQLNCTCILLYHLFGTHKTRSMPKHLTSDTYLPPASLHSLGSAATPTLQAVKAEPEPVHVQQQHQLQLVQQQALQLVQQQVWWLLQQPTLRPPLLHSSSLLLLPRHVSSQPRPQPASSQLPLPAISTTITTC